MSATPSTTPHKICPRCEGRGTIWREGRGMWSTGKAVDCPRCKGGGTIPYSVAEMRRIAMGAVRSVLRERDEQPETYRAYGAWETLRDLAIEEPDTIAAWFFTNTGTDQYHLFFKDWTRWANETRGHR